MRLRVYAQLGRFKQMQAIAGPLMKHDPGDDEYVVMYAIATGRVESVEAAVQSLERAIQRAPQKAPVHYLRASYEAELGWIDAARESLRRAFELDASIRRRALNDPQLKPIFRSLAV